MTMQLAISQQQAQLINGAIDHYNTLVHFVRRSLREDLDYGKIKGCGDKPILFKPGAEKIATLFGFRERLERLEAVKDWTGKNFDGEPFFAFEYRCILTDRQGQHIADCTGSCNSWETKYRFRKAERVCPHCGESTIIKGKSQYGGGWLCYKAKGGCGAKFSDGDPAIEGQEVGLIPNGAIFDQVNTIDKMAQKRAFVGAVILAANASNFFAVEHTEIETVDADWEPAEPIDTAQEMQPIGTAYAPLDMEQVNRQRIATIVEVTGHNAAQIRAMSGVETAGDLNSLQCTELLEALLSDFAATRGLQEFAAREILQALRRDQPGITDANLRDRFLVRLDEYRSEQPASNPPSTKFRGVSID